ncbi:DMT family transporter [Glutamicibacter sp. MNS18]|uniref:DMT family transporter n=1 Tax=Glutamicibacter sp. MNS18 TaxID=2989817 RepID=UPI002235BE73|nr:DMT family transporter [Glutamicibacter sp. MNS18]MCW4465980.1 DMT family transporter [Glutamicibacter sp. MNS18]
MIRGRSGGIAVLLITSVLWGTTGTAAALARDVSPLAIGAVSLGIGGLLQAVVALRPLRRAHGKLAQHKVLLALGGFGVLVYPLAFYSSMHLGGVALGTVISLGSAPLFSGVLERMIDSVRLSRRWYLAATLGIAGSALLGFSRSAQPSVDTGQVVGSCLLGLVAGASYALYSWVTGRLLANGIDRGAAVGAVFGLGGVLLMPVLLATGAPLLASPANIAVAAYLALIPMFVGYLLFGLALTKVSASTATTVTLSEPAVAAALAVWVVGERLGVTGWIGMVLIGVALTVLVARSRTLKPGSELPVSVSGT